LITEAVSGTLVTQTIQFTVYLPLVSAGEPAPLNGHSVSSIVAD